MIDRLMIHRGKASDVLHNADYHPRDAIEGTESLKPGQESLVVLFPPWHNGGFFYDRLAGRLADRGHTVRSYRFRGEILEPNVIRVLDSFRRIQEQVSDEVNQAVATEGYRDVHLIGASLGSVSLAMVASELDYFTTAQFVAGSSNLAQTVWDSGRTSNIREDLEGRQGFTKEQLITAWKPLAPETYANVFREKPVSLLVAEGDLVIPPMHQIGLINVLHENGAEMHVRRTTLGHYAGIAQYCLTGKLPKTQ